MDKFYVQLDGFSRQLVHDYEGVMTKVASWAITVSKSSMVYMAVTRLKA